MSTNSATITVKKANLWSMGVRIWYVIMDTQGVIYQRWSNVGDSTDQVLMLVQPGDKLNIEFGENTSYSMSRVSATPPVGPFSTEAAERNPEPTNIISYAEFA